jgi:polyribonucleotide nucleotidyltransferase
MAATCGATMALLDAGVPLAAPVAGVALGLVSDGDRWQVLMDLQGEEDHYGDMDFKVAGTRHGITAIQMDTKLPGLPWEVVRESLSWAQKGRLAILDHIEAELPAHRQLSPYAPRILTIDISPSQIGELIGPGGKTIQRLIEDNGGKELTSIDVQSTGRVTITSRVADYADSAYAHIRASTQPILVDTVMTGRVAALISDKRNPDVKIGAIVDLVPGKSGMIHISEASPNRLTSIEEVFRVGDEIRVRVLSVDTAKGRIALRPEPS